MSLACCPACESPRLREFHRIESVPVHSCLLLDSRSEAKRFPRGIITLAICETCGFIANTSFDSSVHAYSPDYEESQACSPRFNQFSRALASRWVGEFGLRDRPILEIGCGKGDFLVNMVEAGAGPATGIDPSVMPERLSSPAASEITWVADFFDSRYAELCRTVDAVICRHTLEHIHDVRRFLRSIREPLGESNTLVLFELPDALRVLQEVAFWDIYYEHCSYFTEGSLANLFRAEGFEILDVRLEYDGQYIVLEARAAKAASATVGLAAGTSVEQTARAVDDFSAMYARKLDLMRKEVDQLRASGKRAVIWGAGSKGVAYLNTLGISNEIEFAVDINPRKHGKFMAGTGQEIVSPVFLATYRPDAVIVMNPIYLDEIRADLQVLGLQPDLIAV